MITVTSKMFSSQLIGSQIRLTSHLTKTLFHIEDFESLLWANDRGSIWEMIVSSPISDKNFDDSKSSMWKSVWVAPGSIPGNFHSNQFLIEPIQKQVLMDFHYTYINWNIQRRYTIQPTGVRECHRGCHRYQLHNKLSYTNANRKVVN